MVHSQKAEILYQLVVEKKKDDWNNLPRLYTSNDFVSFYLVIDVSLLGGAKAKPSQGTNVNCCLLPLNELNGVQCSGADLGGGCRGCALPPPEMTCGFLIQLAFCKKKLWFIGVEVEQETSAPPPNKNPGSAPVTRLRRIIRL